MPIPAIKIKDLLSQMKSLLQEKIPDAKVTIGLVMLQPIIADKVIFISPDSAPKDEMGSGVWNKEININITAIYKTGNLYVDKPLFEFLDFIEDIEGYLQDYSFSNEIVRNVVEIADFDSVATGEQDFIYAGLIIYKGTIKGV